VRPLGECLAKSAKDRSAFSAGIACRYQRSVTAGSECPSTSAWALYLAIVLDAWSRRIVGWAMTTHLRTELVLDALQMAASQRKPEEVIHHSDQGCQHTSIAFGQRCRELGVRPSMVGRRSLRQRDGRELLRDP
jgi:transposase InsO family protein